MLFISSQPSATNNVNYLRLDFLVCQTHSVPVWAEVTVPCGWAQRHSCCVPDAWGAASAVLQPPWVFIYFTFHKTIQKSQKLQELEISKISPQTEQPHGCLQGLGGRSCHQVLSAPRKDICILYARGECSSCLGSGYCCHFSEDNSLGTELLQGWTGGHLKSNILRRKKKGLQVLMRNY